MHDIITLVFSNHNFTLLCTVILVGSAFPHLCRTVTPDLQAILLWSYNAALIAYINTTVESCVNEFRDTFLKLKVKW